MGRRENPVSTRNAELLRLAEWLREQRELAGLTYRQLAGRAGYHATTLQRAASGATVPKLGVVLAYARACEASPDHARILWKRARFKQARGRHGPRARQAPPAALVRDFADLSAALLHLYERAGSPPLRSMERAAGGYGALPRSTAHRILHKQTVPHSPAQFMAYLDACEVPESEQEQWVEAYSRAWKLEKEEQQELQLLRNYLELDLASHERRRRPRGVSAPGAHAPPDADQHDVVPLQRNGREHPATVITMHMKRGRSQARLRAMDRFLSGLAVRGDNDTS
ncbi:helix-turn-helix domain-containing protein [Streptomyces syringium]|uniref:helix-turn-helix domain-containing protein n=1 Tax=Streptomyces syringium TaxID=76729 RepID=UPI0033CE396D